MPERLVRTVLLVLLAAAVVFPIAICILLGLGRLLGAMGDVAGAAGLDRAALAAAAVWGITLVCLILLQGIHVVSQGESHRNDDDSPGS